MLPNEEKTSVNIRSETPSFVAFESNMDRLNQIARILSADLTTVGVSPTKSEEVLERHWVVLEWIPVMLVSFAEAYLQDVLAYLACTESALMEKSDISAKYSDVLLADSINSLAAELRARWSRNIVEDGGPPKWLARLERMGARGYHHDLARVMDLIWGVRHVVVHSASVATPEFVRRHPDFGVSAGSRVKVTPEQLGGWINLVYAFAKTTDAFVVARTAPAIESS